MRLRCSAMKYARVRIASSLIGGAVFFAAAALRDAGFLRGELAFWAAGLAALPFSAVSSVGVFDLSVPFAFLGMAKQVSL